MSIDTNVLTKHNLTQITIVCGTIIQRCSPTNISTVVHQYSKNNVHRKAAQQNEGAPSVILIFLLIGIVTVTVAVIVIIIRI